MFNHCHVFWSRFRKHDTRSGSLLCVLSTYIIAGSRRQGCGDDNLLYAWSSTVDDRSFIQQAEIIGSRPCSRKNYHSAVFTARFEPDHHLRLLGMCRPGASMTCLRPEISRVVRHLCNLATQPTGTHASFPHTDPPHHAFSSPLPMLMKCVLCHRHNTNSRRNFLRVKRGRFGGLKTHRSL